MSKMGVSTVASYTGAQIFEAVGLSPAVVDRYFTGTTSKLGGVGLDVLAEEVAPAAPARVPARTDPAGRTARSTIGGEYQWRREGEPHLFDPETVFRLQHSTRSGALRHLQAVHERWSTTQSERLMTLRGLFRFADRTRPGPDRRGRAGRRRSSSGSRPARCRTARSARRRTRRWRSR